MKKLDLTGWAALSEIVGTVAIVVSLLFVAYTIERNTAIMQSTNDNFLHEADDRYLTDLILNPDFASIVLRFRNNEELSGVDQIRYNNYRIRELSMWEQAYDRHKDGLLSDEKWTTWNRGLALNTKRNIPKELWANQRVYYGEDFAMHVDAIY